MVRPSSRAAPRSGWRSRGCPCRSARGWQPERPGGAALTPATAVGLALAEALAGSSASVVLAVVLLCALLGLVAYFIKQARASQDTTELLLVQLEDAREEQLQAAAISERSRIASELHDVL